MICKETQSFVRAARNLIMLLKWILRKTPNEQPLAVNYPII